MATKTKPAASKATDKSDKAAKAEKPKAPHEDKRGRLPHPSLKVDKDSNPTAQFDSIPDDYDPAKHWPLKSKNFKNEFDWFEFKATEADARAKLFREKAEESKLLGSSDERAKLKKFLAMKKRYDALQKELEDDGTDVEEALEKLEAAKAEG